MELSGSVMDGMNHDCPDSNHFSGPGFTAEGIAEESSAQALALLAPVDGEPCNQDETDWMVCEPLDKSFGCFVLVGRTGNQRVVADHAFVEMPDVCFGCLGTLIGPSVTFAPVVSNRMAAIEVEKLMILRQLFDDHSRV